jgi:hypothetical protein
VAVVGAVVEAAAKAEAVAVAEGAARGAEEAEVEGGGLVGAARGGAGAACRARTRVSHPGVDETTPRRRSSSSGSGHRSP